MDINRITHNLFNLNLKPINKQNNFIQIIHFYNEEHFPYISNEETKLNTYKLPENMSYEDFFKILSYYTVKLDKISTYPCSLDEAKYIEQLLPLIGCEKVEENVNSDVFKLYLICGPVNDDTPKYYEWFSKNVNEEEIGKMCIKYGINYFDVFNSFLEKYKPEEKAKALVRSMLLPSKK